MRFQMVDQNQVRKWPLWIAFAVTILIGSLIKPFLQENEFPIQFDRHFSRTHFATLVSLLVLLQMNSALLFVDLMQRLGFRYGSIPESVEEIED